jgi:peptide/nickel transport system substrate-binding protein
MKSRVTWFVASFILVLVMVLVSCGPATPTQTSAPTATPTATPTAAPTTTPGKEMVKDFMGRLVEKPQYGGTFRPAFQTDLGSPDPADGASISTWVFNMPFEKLGIGDWSKAGAGTGEQLYLHSSYFDYAKYGKPNLAESWEMPDSLTLTVHIRQGIHFQNKAPVNGRELTAEDVRYCFQRYFEDTAAPCEWRPYIASITTTDRWTVVFKWKQPYCNAVADICFGRVYIYAPELVTTYGNLKDWKNWVGTGAFIMTDYVQGSSYTFVKNPNYWATDEIVPGNKLPYVNKVQAIIITDASTILASLRTGKTDVVWEVTPTSYQTLKTATQLRSVAFPDWNVSPLVFMRVDEPPFNDLRVRQAMMMAIDFKGIIKDYLGGDAVPLVFPVMPTWGDIYTPLEQMPADVQELYSYNVAKAKELMTEAGYPNGYSSDVDFIAWPGMSDRCQLLAGYWKAIGINCKISTPDTATAVGKIWSRNFHGLATVTAGITGPITCLTWATSTHTYDFGRYNNPAYDALIAKLVATTDPAAQTDLIKQGVVMLYRDIPHIYFPGQNCYTVWQPWVKNYHGEVCVGGVMGYNTWTSRIWIDEGLKESMGY